MNKTFDNTVVLVSESFVLLKIWNAFSKLCTWQSCTCSKDNLMLHIVVHRPYNFGMALIALTLLR